MNMARLMENGAKATMVLAAAVIALPTLSPIGSIAAAEAAAVVLAGFGSSAYDEIQNK